MRGIITRGLALVGLFLVYYMSVTLLVMFEIMMIRAQDIEFRTYISVVHVFMAE